MNLGDLRALVARLEDQSDDVPVEIEVTLRAFRVPTGSFPNPSTTPLKITVPATHYRIGQTPGYMVGRGEAAFIQIEADV